MINQEKQKKFVLAVAFYGIIFCAIYFSVRFLFPPLLPFILGFLVAGILHRPSIVLAKKFHLTQKIPTVILVSAFYITAFVLIALIGVKVGTTAGEIFPKLPALFSEQVLPFVNSCFENMKHSLGQFDSSVSSMIDVWLSEMTASLSQGITAVSTYVIKLMSSIAMGTPEMILRIVLTVVSTFFIAMDFDRIIAFIKKLLPTKYNTVISQMKEKAITSIAIFIRSYTLIFLLTFVELSVGFWLLKIPYAVELGILIAVVDIMPILGTGLVLLPWALIAVVIGKPFLGIGLFLMYIGITAIRNIVEPKLVGGKIGLHPLAALISMFVGLQLLGIWGMFLFPVTLSLVIQLKRDGLLPQVSLW